MKRFSSLRAFAAVGVIGVGAATVVIAQDQGQDMATMMETMAEAGAPGPEHKALEAIVGSWHAEGEFYMGPVPSKWSGSAKNTMIMGGRFLRGDFEAPQMLGGPDFEGMSIIGFNRMKGHYESIWIDSMAGGIYNETGKYDAATKTFHFKGTQVDPMSGAESPTHSVMRITGPDAHEAEMYMVMPDGSESLQMKISYTRK